MTWTHSSTGPNRSEKAARQSRTDPEEQKGNKSRRREKKEETGDSRRRSNGGRSKDENEERKWRSTIPSIFKWLKSWQPLSCSRSPRHPPSVKATTLFLQVLRRLEVQEEENTVIVEQHASQKHSGNCYPFLSLMEDVVGFNKRKWAGGRYGCIKLNQWQKRTQKDKDKDRDEERHTERKESEDHSATLSLPKSVSTSRFGFLGGILSF